MNAAVLVIAAPGVGMSPDAAGMSARATGMEWS